VGGEQKADRRRHRRFPLSAGVQLHHGPSSSDIPGRCVDISDSGMLMYVPVSAPVRSGQPIRLTLTHIKAEQYKGLSDRPLKAKIVRVQRQGLLLTGKLAIGVEFVEGLKDG